MKNVKHTYALRHQQNDNPSAKLAKKTDSINSLINENHYQAHENRKDLKGTLGINLLSTT